MPSSTPATLLTINMGSSSLKAAVFAAEEEGVRRLAQAEASGVAGLGGSLFASDGSGREIERQPASFTGFGEALDGVLGRFRAQFPGLCPAAVGHRVVHGGPLFSEPEVVHPSLLDELRRLVPIDPLHAPQAIAGIELAGKAFPNAPQVACFDTAFHRRMPPKAQMYALPRSLWDQGVRRYGFHGLSFEYVSGELRRLDPASAAGRVIVAHLGSGCSLAAIRDGQPVDTTMGFSPSGGLAMSTRSGDLDPGVLIYLLRRGMSADELDDLVNRRAGLLGLSGITGDMRELLQRQQEEAAQQAVNVFCYQAQKHLGALAAALGGLDTLVFTGGIGEHAAPVRQQICDGLGFLGLRLQPEANAAGEPVISTSDSRITVRVIPTDEDLMVARHTQRLLWKKG